MSITLHQLKVFNQVAKSASVSKAANLLHLTQPGVSNIIRQLEEHYGCNLVERDGRRIRVSAYGTTLINGIRSILTTLDELDSKIAQMKGALAGTLSVATVSTAKYFLPQLLGEFKKQHPDVHIKLVVGNRLEIIERLEQNLDDFVIMSNPPRLSSVDYIDFYKDSLIAISSPDNVLAAKKTLNFSDLKQCSWIMREAGSGTRFATEKILSRYNLKPNVEMEINDIEALKHAIIADMGISIISAHSVNIELSNGIVCELPVKNLPKNHMWYLVKSINKTLAPLGQAFYNYVTDKTTTMP